MIDDRADDSTRERERERERDRDPAGRPRQARPRDATGRPLPYGDPRGVDPVPETPLPPEQALATAQELLDTGRAFSAHEVLEAAWKAAPAADRDLWQGLAQVCVGITHAQRGNLRGSTALLERATARLGGYRDSPPHGVDVAGLLNWYDRNRTSLATAPVPRLRAADQPT